MAKFRIEKVVSSLPATLVPDTVYAVRVGTGFDLYVSDTTGSTAHKLNEVNTQRTDEEIQDVVNSLLVGSGNISLTYDDVANTLTIDDTHSHTESDITDLQNYELAFTKNTAFNKDLGTVAGTVAEGNHSHSNLHSHSNKTLLDSLINTGDGTSYLADDGTYKTVQALGGSWGSITGTLSDQTDLQSALNGKSATGHTHTEADITDLQSYALSTHNHDSAYLGINAKATDANLLDGLNSSQFLRSDANDTTTGKLTANGGYETGDFQIQFNSTTNSLDFNYIGA